MSLWILALNLGLLCLLLISFVAIVSTSDPLSYSADDDFSPAAILAQVNKGIRNNTTSETSASITTERTALFQSTMTSPLTLASGYFGVMLVLTGILINPLTEWLAAFKKSLHFQH